MIRNKLCLVAFCAFMGLSPIVPSSDAAEELQLLRNGNFEEDELSFRGEPANSCGGNSNDQWYNMQDRFPDGWTSDKNYPSPYGMGKQSEWPIEDAILDATISQFGKSSLRLTGKSISIRQVLEWNKVTNLYQDRPATNEEGEASWNPKPSLDVREALFQDLVLKGSFKTFDVPEDAKAAVKVDIAALDWAIFEIPSGTSDWRSFELPLTTDSQAAAFKSDQSQSGKTITVALDYRSPNGKGKVWFDDFSLTVAPRPEPNLLPNSSFEAIADGSKAPPAKGRGSNLSGAMMPPAGTPYPEGWSAPMKWVYLPPPYYYVWNNWQHFFGECRNYPKLDTLVARTGNHSLRLDLLAGDEYALESPTIKLSQKEARPIEVTAWVKADRLRHVDFMLVDKKGRRLATNQTLMYHGGPLSGTHEWIAIRKIFQGYEPVKSLRLRIGGRGFNGTTKTDIGDWHAYNQVSTVWIDDIAVREVYSTPDDLNARKVVVPSPSRDNKVSPSIVQLDLGERLYGENAISAQVKLDKSSEPVSVALQATLTTPSGKNQVTKTSPTLKTDAGAESVKLTVPYELKELSPSWRKPGQMKLALLVNGEVSGEEIYHYGTWPVTANVRPSKACLDETENPILVTINLGIAERTLARVRSLKIEVLDRRSGQRFVRETIKNVPEAIASAQIAHHDKDRFYFYMPRVGLLDHRNLILKEIDISKLPVRPWRDPESRFIIRVTGRGLFCNIFTADSHPFARLTEFDEVLEPIEKVTVDPIGNFFRVNGEPFFLFAHSHGNGAANGGAPPTRSCGFGGSTILNSSRLSSLNGLFRWTFYDFSERCWNDYRMYAPMLLSQYWPDNFPDALERLEKGEIVVAKSWRAGEYRPLKDISENPWALTYFITMDEAMLEIRETPESLKAHTEYANAVRDKINRVVGVMDNHSQFYPFHDDGGYLNNFDALYFEREGGGVFRPELTLRNWKKRKKCYVMVDLPQAYENVPYERERYRALTNTMNGTRGWFGIQGCSDPSLYRLMRGEFEHIFTYLSANEGGVEVLVPEGITARAWKKGKKVLVMAEQHNPIPHGKWTWVNDIGGRKGPAHTGVSSHLATPVKEGYAIHGYNDDLYREVHNGDSIEQEVYVSPENVPEAIFLVVPGNGGFNHIAYWGEFDHREFVAKKVDAFLAGECYSHASYGINWYRSETPSWLEYQAKMRFPKSCFARMGDLPQAGKWTTLTVPINTLNLADQVVDGLMYITSGDGLAYWGKSVLVRGNGAREVMIDDRIGRDSEQFKNANITVPGLEKGTVRVIGEYREIKMKDGSWTDDLMGEDLYDCFNEGYLGDGITYGSPRDSLPDALELSYTYDNSPRCIRVYEVVPH